MSKRLKGKVAIVTGAGRGLGRAEAMALAAEGAAVLVNDLGVATDGTGTQNNQPADEVVTEIRRLGGEAVANYDSVASSDGAENIVKTAVDSFGRLDILVNNAGILRHNWVWEMTDDEFDAVVKTHLYGHFYTTRAACRKFREQRSGRIINTSSGSGQGILEQRANYASAKEGIVGLTKAVATDMSQFGVTCNAIRPMASTRMVATPQFLDQVKQLRATGDPLAIATAHTMEQTTKMLPEDVAPFVVYLATDEASYITGCLFEVFSTTIVLQAGPVSLKAVSAEGRWTIDRLVEIFPATLGKDIAGVRKLSGGLA